VCSPERFIMKIITGLVCVSVIGALAAACGGDDDDNDNDDSTQQTAGAGGEGSEASHMGGGDGKSDAAAGESGKNTDTGAAGSDGDGTGGSGGKDQGGPGTLVGSCDAPDYGFCTTYECVGDTVCENAEVGYPQACDALEGTWSDKACSEANALGACRDPSSTGDTIVVYPEDGWISASIAEESCTDDGGTFTAL
jgi:hypothetical protein